MSGILDQIDDTLGDWNGSVDAMRWRPVSDAPSPVSFRITIDTERLMASLTGVREAFTQITSQLAAAAPAMASAAAMLGKAFPSQPVPRPSALDARYHRRYRNRQGRR